MKHEHRRSLSKIRLFLAAALVFAGCALSVWVQLPVHTTETVIQIKGNLEGYPASPLKDRQVRITLPVELVFGSAVPVEVTLLPALTAEGQTPGGAYSIEGRLDLPGMEIFPAESIQTPYIADKPLSFRWLVTAHDTGSEAGRIWLYVNQTTPVSGETQVPVLVRPIDLPVRSYFGLPGAIGVWVGWGLTIVGLGWAGWFVLQRKRKND